MNEEKEAIASIVSNKTGEIIGEIHPGDRIIHTDKDPEIYYDFNKDKNFVKLFEGVNKLRKYLTSNEFVIAMSLADFVCYEDCILRNGGHHNGKILTITDLSELMDIKYDALRRTMYSLIKKGIIGIHKTGCKDKPNIMVKAITVNPNVFMRGCNVNATIKSLYEHSNWLAEDLEESKPKKS